MEENSLWEPPGLGIAINDTIRRFLCSAAVDPTLSPQLQRSASHLSSSSSSSSVPYKPLRALWLASAPSSRPRLALLFSGSRCLFASPKPRQKSEELQARLRKLSELAERNAYAELVKDITPKKDVNEPFSSYKDQLGFGLHVAVTMFTGFLVGYFAFGALFSHSPVMNVAGGLLGLVCAMLLETFLFIIRTSTHDRRSSSSNSKLKKNQ